MDGFKGALGALASLGLCACGSANVKPAVPPELALLTDAEAMVAKASAANADALAPKPLLEARRHLTSARALLYQNAEPQGQLGEVDSQRVQWLADAAVLDARLALIRAQTQRLRAQGEAAAPARRTSPGVPQP